MRGEAVKGEGRKQMKEDIAGSNERGTRRGKNKPRKRNRTDIQEERGTVENKRQRKEEETRRRGEG